MCQLRRQEPAGGKHSNSNSSGNKTNIGRSARHSARAV